jgi:hypothetical protein
MNFVKNLKSLFLQPILSIEAQAEMYDGYTPP